MPVQKVAKITPPQLIHSCRLIIASNRGPVEYQLTRDKTLKARRGAGEMVRALTDVGNRMDATWIAMAMTEGDCLAAKQAQQHNGLLPSLLPGQKMHLRYVSITKEAYHKHYEKISHELLWFLQHYMYDPTQDATLTNQLQDAWENGYLVANQAIAQAVNAEIEREPTMSVVMLQDYHLYLAPAMIRQSHPDVLIQHFIHIPWPDVRCWHFLPSKIVQAIYQGLVGNDIIGFQTERDVDNFLEGARTLLDGAVVDFEEGAVWWQGHRTQARAYPVSISIAEARKTINSASGKRAAETIKPLLRERTIMRIDQMEPTKNLVRGFQAYAQVLEKHPELRRKVVFLAFLAPTRRMLPMYRRFEADVRSLIDEINETYGTDDWMPIQAFFSNDRIHTLAAMQFYDVLLVNPIIDGMNLVAKEGAIVNERDGVIVLSRTVGAFHQLAKGSIPTSPIDVEETAEALYKALTLSPEERKSKAATVRQAVENNDLTRWSTRQIHDINDLLDRTVTHLNLPGPKAQELLLQSQRIKPASTEEAEELLLVRSKNF